MDSSKQQQSHKFTKHHHSLSHLLPFDLSFDLSFDLLVAIVSFCFELHLSWNALCLSPDNQRPVFKEIKFSASWTESSSSLEVYLDFLPFKSKPVDDNK
jgi:hypothetical protein